MLQKLTMFADLLQFHADTCGYCCEKELLLRARSKFRDADDCILVSPLHVAGLSCANNYFDHVLQQFVWLVYAELKCQESSRVYRTQLCSKLYWILGWYYIQKRKRKYLELLD